MCLADNAAQWAEQSRNTTQTEVGRLDLHAETQSWRSHAFHGGTHRHTHHCAKGQRLMVISHPCPASRAVTLSCWFSRALLMTKLPLQITLPQSLRHRLSPSPFGRPRLNKAEECGGSGERTLQVRVGQGSGPGKLHRWCRRPPGMSSFQFMKQAHHGHRYVPAPWQLGTVRQAGEGPSLTAGELCPAVRVYSLQGRSAEYSSFRWMIKWVAQQEVKQLDFLPHYHGNLISGIMRY